MGRFVTTPLMKYVSPSKLLGIYGAANVVLMAMAVTQPGMLGAYAIVGGKFLPVDHVPDDLCAGVEGAGREYEAGGSLLVMAIVGGALFPLALGWIAKTTGSLALGYLVPLVGFAGVSLYGFLAPWIGAREVEAVPQNICRTLRS